MERFHVCRYQLPSFPHRPFPYPYSIRFYPSHKHIFSAIISLPHLLLQPPHFINALPHPQTPINCNFAVLYETSQFPASNASPWVDPVAQKTASLANDKGVVLRVVDFPPRTETLYHRTVSLDFGILFAGEIDWSALPPRSPVFLAILPPSCTFTVLHSPWLHTALRCSAHHFPTTALCSPSPLNTLFQHHPLAKRKYTAISTTT